MQSKTREQEDQFASIVKSQGIDLDKFKAKHPEKVIHSDDMLKRVLLSPTLKESSLHALSIIIDYSERTGYSILISVKPIPFSRTIDMNNYFSTKVRSINNVVSIEKFTEQIILVQLTKNSRKWITSEVFGGTLVVVKNRDGWVNVFLKKNNGYINLETNLLISSLPSDSEYIINKYALEPVQVSKSRKLSGVFRNITNVDNRFEIFDDATYGAMTKLKAALEDRLSKVTCDADLKEVKEKAERAYGYLGNVQTSSVNLGTVPGFHVYHGKWTNTTKEYFLRKDFIETMEKMTVAMQEQQSPELINELAARLEEIKNSESLEDAPTQDGQMYADVAVLIKMIFEHTGYLVHSDLLLGRMLQIRPATIKASCLIVAPEVYKQFVKGSIKLGKKNGIEVEHYGKSNESLFIADMNCIKLDFDMEKEFTFELLAINKCSKSSASKQIYNNVAYAYQKLNNLEYGMKLIKESLGLAVNRTINNATKVREPKQITPGDLLKAQETGYYTDLINAIAPTYKNQSKEFLTSIWKQSITSAVNIIDKMHGDLEIQSRRLASDPVFILTGGNLPGILRLGESFINDELITKSVMFKYPVVGLEEHYSSINVSVDKISNRSKDLHNYGIITETERESIVRFFTDIRGSIRVLPALMFLSNACAGLDFDYDGECSMIYTCNPTTRSEEITNEFIDTISENAIRGVNITA